MSYRENKEVYNFTEALNQPNWVQKITNRISLPFAIKLSSIIWLLLFELLAVWLGLRLAQWTPLPFPFWLVLGSFASFYLSLAVADLKIDQKNFIKFVVDYVWFYLKFGRKARKSYLNDGYIYKKQKELLEREVKRVKKS